MGKKIISSLGRKKKNSAETGFHDKYCQDNLFHRFKLNFLKELMDFINGKIKEIYAGNIGKGIFTKKLFPINHSQFNNCKISYNIELLNKSIGEIFSNKLNKKFSIYKLNHNIKLIEELKNEQDEEKNEKLNNILNFTFLNCLEHFRSTKFFFELTGLEAKYNKMINDLSSKGETEEYIKLFQDLIINYEKYLYIKKPRKRRKTKQNKL